jgi:hypothetical protein
MNKSLKLLVIGSFLFSLSCDKVDEVDIQKKLKEGLLVYYSFDGGSVEDETGTYPPGQVFGATLVVDRNGREDSAYYFDDHSDQIILGNILDDVQEPFTISVWARPESQTETALFASQSNLPGVYGGFYLFVGTNSFGIMTGDGAGYTLANRRNKTKFNLSDMDGKWAHYCAVVKAVDQIDLYVNGEKFHAEFDGGDHSGINSNFPSSSATIGSYQEMSWIYSYKGEVDELKVWNRALADSEVHELAKN